MVDILLSTYNGERYLKQQIDSIIGQSFSDWRLIVRDDDSKDRTRELLEEYSFAYPQKIKIITDSYGNIGVIKSFEELLKNSNSDYIMFCDQDDVWLPEKIRMSLQTLKDKEHENLNIPILLFSDLTVVDESLNVINNSFWSYSNIKPHLLMN